MKTAEERADLFVSKLPDSCHGNIDEIKEQFVIELKRQDKITRHACAETALYEYGNDIFADYTWEDLHEQRQVISKAIMNTKAI
jgi:hypothetical protein